MSTILVIGSTGNIGSFVVKELIKRGASVKAAVTNSDRGKTFFLIYQKLKSLHSTFCHHPPIKIH